MKWIKDLQKEVGCDDNWKLRLRIQERINESFKRSMTDDSVEQLMATCQMVKETVESLGENENNEN
jgi:hypothetical protein